MSEDLGDAGSEFGLDEGQVKEIEEDERPEFHRERIRVMRGWLPERSDLYKPL